MNLKLRNKIYQIAAHAITRRLVSVYWASLVVGRFEPLTLSPEDTQAHPLASDKVTGPSSVGNPSQIYINGINLLVYLPDRTYVKTKYIQ